MQIEKARGDAGGIPSKKPVATIPAAASTRTDGGMLDAAMVIGSTIPRAIRKNDALMPLRPQVDGVEHESDDVHGTGRPGLLCCGLAS